MYIKALFNNTSLATVASFHIIHGLFGGSMNYKIVICALLSLSAIGCRGLSNPFQATQTQTIERFQLQNDLALDTRSGLMWTRCLQGTTWNGYTCTGIPSLYSWQQLQTIPKTVNYQGYSDWRTPTLEELKTLANSDSTTPLANIPHLNQVVFPMPNCLGVEAGLTKDNHACWQWTSTPIEGSGHYAWIVYFGYGYGSANYEVDTFALRLVRTNR